MKDYSNPSRKPMMSGGMAKPKKKMMAGGTAKKPTKKMVTGGDARANADAQSRLATGRATAADRKADDTQRREEIMRMPMADIRKLANGSGKDAMIARSVLREKGDTGAMPSGDKEPAGNAYGGKTKMAMGGKAKMAAGGKPMAKDPKTGKMKPTYAMDGKGKMMKGGKAKKS